MRKTLCCFVILLSCLVLNGCGVAFHQNAANAAKTAKPEDYGPVPTNYKESISELMEIVLIDPESVRYSNWLSPQQAIIPESYMSPKAVLGWQVNVFVNSRNRMGGYTGAKPLGFFFVNNRIYAYGEILDGKIQRQYVK